MSVNAVCNCPVLDPLSTLHFLFENKYFFMHFCQAAKRELFKTDDIPTYYVVTVLSPVPLMHAHKSAERSEKKPENANKSFDIHF